MSKTKEQPLPSWFNGVVYDKGAVVRNRFGGGEIELNNVELSMYDFIIGSQMVFEMAPNTVTPQKVKDFQKGLDWFRKNNSQAYMVLLD